MTDTDEDDETLKSCPYCEKSSCEHKLVESSVYNEDWCGALPNATRALSRQLKEAVVRALEAGDEPPGSSALTELFERARDEAPGSADDFPGSWLHDYWLELARDLGGVEVVEFDFDEAGPGTGETYRDVYAEEPKEALGKFIAAARADLASMAPPAPGRRAR